MDKVKLKKIKVAKEEQSRYPVETSPMTLPTLYVNSDQMPEIADWEVGKKYRLIIEVEQKSKSEVAVAGKSEIVDARFNIVGYKALDTKMNEDDLTEEEQAEGRKSR